MKQRERFSDDILASARKGKILGLRAGSGAHRFIGLWVVVVEDRVFVRSWGTTPGGWHDALRTDPHGTINVDGVEIAVRAVFTRSVRLNDAVDAAYAEKYNTPGAAQYVRDLQGPASRATTTEFVPR